MRLRSLFIGACSSVLLVDMCGIAAKTKQGKEQVAKVEAKVKEGAKSAEEKSKAIHEGVKEVVKEVGNKVIDKFIPGGDNSVAHGVWEDTIDGNPRAVGRAVLQPSQISPLQGQPGIPLTNVKAGDPVVPAGPSNDTAITREQVKDTPVVPASPTNENAVPVHEGNAAQSPAEAAKGFVERSVTPAMPKDVGVTPGGSGSIFGPIGATIQLIGPSAPPQHEHGQVGPSGGGGGHAGGWAGPDHPSAVASHTG
jgi:hypothetical protein